MMKKDDELTVASALDKVQSESVTERKEGLADLQHVLEANRRPDLYAKLNDKSFHWIFEVLFKTASKERSYYVSATRSSLKSSYASRLSLCASVFRSVVDIATPKIRVKTVRAIVDHIIQTLPTAEEGVCTPLSVDYLKALTKILENQPHVEHFAKATWLNVVDFCTFTIRNVEGSQSLVSSGSADIAANSLKHNGLVQSSVAGQSIRAQPSSESREVPVQLIHCLKHLATATNAPLLERTRDILQVVVDFLKNRRTTTPAHHAGLQTVNLIMARVSLDSVGLMDWCMDLTFPLIKKLWSKKELALQDEILITLLQCKEHMAARDRSTSNLFFDIEVLLEEMRKEYFDHREHRGHLELDDLNLDVRSIPQNTVMPLQSRTFSLRPANAKSEHNYTVLHFIAFLSCWCDLHTYSMRNVDNQKDGDATSKRRRVTQKFEDLLTQAYSTSHPERLYTMQVIAFYVDVRPFSQDEMVYLMKCLTASVSHQNSLISSWALIALAGCAVHRCAASAELQPIWMNIWQSLSRLITSFPHSRAACHTMDVILQMGCVPYQLFAESVNTIISSVGLNAAATLSDSALSLWSTALRMRAIHNPGVALSRGVENMMSWITSKWTASNLENRHHAYAAAHNVSSEDLARAFSLSLGTEYLNNSGQAFANLGTIGHVWLRRYHCRELTAYLLLNKDQSTKPDWSAINVEQAAANSSAPVTAKIYAAVLDFFLVESETANSKWQSTADINGDVFYMIISFCLVGGSVASCASEAHSRKAEDLQKRLVVLIEAVFNFISRPECHENAVEQVLIACAPFVLDVSCVKQFSILQTTPFLSIVYISLADALATRRQAFMDRGSKTTMLSEDNYGEFSAYSITSLFPGEDSFPRHSLAAQSSSYSFCCCIEARVTLLSHVIKALAPDSASAIVPTSFIDHMLTLESPSILASRPFLRQLMSSDLSMTSTDTERLLEGLSSKFLETYEYSRCEVALEMCLDCLSGTALQWTDEQFESLAEGGANMYIWFSDTILSACISSPEVKINIAGLLYRLLEITPDYKPRESKASVRTILFRILKSSELLVQYHVAKQISDLFGLFVISQHELIFNDVFDSLPQDVESIEGIAIRILILSRLAAAWKTLLRRCLYYIFETAGLIKEVLPYATVCMKNISDFFELKQPSELFALFSSQILYTWLNSKPLQSMPYSVFGYTSLQGLLNDVQGELISQLIMRGDEKNLKELEVALSTPANIIVTRFFARTAAYSFGRDVTSLNSDGARSHDAEARVISLLGKTRFLALLMEQVPSVLGYMFLRLEQEYQFERSLAKRPGNEESFKVLTMIKGISSSESSPSISQQPSFRARHLLDEIDRLCRWVSKDATKIWTANVVIVVARMLFDDVHHVFGITHTQRVIHRVRILIALAGRTALQGYPLKMLVHAIRPYVTDKYCADDALSILQYLLDSGREYFYQEMPFVAGTCIAVFLSLRDLLNSKQDSITQESHHLATLSKGQKFREWLTAYCQTYNHNSSQSLDSKAFDRLIRTARAITGKGTANAGNPEGELLKQVLKQVRHEAPFLPTRFIELNLGLLCKDFLVPPSFHDDLLGEERSAADFSVSIWKSNGYRSMGRGYGLWAARVLGRSFLHSGEVLPEISAETQYQYFRKLGNSRMQGLSRSKVAIINSVVDLLHSENSLQVGVAEDTLKALLSSVQNTEEGALIENYLPAALVSAFSSANSLPSNASLDDVAPHSELQQCFASIRNQTFDDWARDLTIAMALGASNEPILRALPRLLRNTDGLAVQLFPHVLHLFLLTHWDAGTDAREQISDGVRRCFQSSADKGEPHARLSINALFYLRSQPIPHETTRFERSQWLSIDYQEAAIAARSCGMYKSALLLIELSQTMSSRSPKRSSEVQSQALLPSEDLLLAIFRQVDEPDSFYGVSQTSDLDAIADRLEFEGHSVQSLLLRGAQFDSQLRGGHVRQADIASGVISSLSRLSLNGLTQQLIADRISENPDGKLTDNLLAAAMKLRQWDIAVPATTSSDTSILYRTFQSINNATNRNALNQAVELGLMDVYTKMRAPGVTSHLLWTSFTTLAALTEIDEIVTSSGDQLMDLWTSRLKCRGDWLGGSSYETGSRILTSRETMFGIISGNNRLQTILHCTPRESRLMEMHVNLSSSALYRDLGASQDALSNVTYLSEVADMSRSHGIKLDGAIGFETSNVLWNLGETVPSIKMLQHIDKTVSWADEAVQIGKARVLATLGHRVSEARLEKPLEIQNKYLKRALAELKDCQDPVVAGQVYHEFAAYCHSQLFNADTIDELRRSERFRAKKQDEIRELEEVINTSKHDKEKHRLAMLARGKAKQWLRLDDSEHKRLFQTREQFLRHSLGNYLLSLATSDSHDTDVLKFVALWLEHADLTIANDAVATQIAEVPTSKFTSLMNQLASRLQDSNDKFQLTLSGLVKSICLQHPFHGMNHIFAGSKTSGGSDKKAISRNAAAMKIAQDLHKDRDKSSIWTAICSSNEIYLQFAEEKSAETKQGAKLPLRKLTSGKMLERDIPGLTVPPITLSLDVRKDLDYSSVPTIKHFKPEMAIASGLSHPKIVTAIASDGTPFKQLFKGGIDDLRQDAIMEQVFGQVTELLQRNKATRRRNLKIRTYKVIPLDATSGAIEFVPQTICLNDFLVAAHQRYHPKDLKWMACRNKIDDSHKQGHHRDQRIKVFKEVIERFSPVLRHFFFERFEDPDEWFKCRLAYTRSAAAISILGHVLGLGDRHCQNILLDQHTGEVVHIDLGVAFEAGRILNVPEVVPFRLTRDIVDGFGVLKTEGVFRRCCEFTLEALREHKDAIMTLLNVFRYDPLHNWTISPLRAKRLQEDQEREMAGVDTSMAPSLTSRSTRSSHAGPKEELNAQQKGKDVNPEDEGDEADRALSVVERKLSTGLSVAATVHELIQQATDEKNLAMLFCGWAAYA